MRESPAPRAETSALACNGAGLALPPPDRDSALEHAAELIGAAWRRFFYHPRPTEPLRLARTRWLLSRALPTTPSDPNQGLHAAAGVLERSLARSGRHWFSCTGSSRLEIGVAIPEVVASVAWNA